MLIQDADVCRQEVLGLVSAHFTAIIKKNKNQLINNKKKTPVHQIFITVVKSEPSQWQPNYSAAKSLTKLLFVSDS